MFSWLVSEIHWAKCFLRVWYSPCLTIRSRHYGHQLFIVVFTKPL